ncbi:MAG TPA: nuclear transport factor 2 family protein [Mycobacterium sp.]|jgi:predicted SnoaL-like aldol condensation-catalyzing enzyme|nr:nuclear transport factor 2 family protein [Mycobacterium sp.]
MTITEAEQASNRVVRRVLSDGEYVVNHSLIIGESGPIAVRFDLWHIANGAVAEHWADKEQWAPDTANGHTQIDGAQAIDHGEDTETTRKIVTSTVQTILVDGDTSALDDYLAGEAYIQHNPRFADGVSGLVAALTALAQQGITMKYDGIRQVVADGNFAYIRSEGVFGEQPFVFHDLFRVADGRCIEHWDVMVPRR